MLVDRALGGSIFAGALAGAAGLVVFTALHWFLLAPTFGVLLFGAPFAMLAGCAAGWAFHELRRAGALPEGPRGGLAFGLLLWMAMLPVAVVASARGAVPVQPPIDAVRLLTDLAVAAPAGALAGGLLARSARPALAVAVAALAFALTLGHNVPFFPSGDAGLRAQTVMLAVSAAAGVVLERLAARFASPPAALAPAPARQA